MWRNNGGSACLLPCGNAGNSPVGMGTAPQHRAGRLQPSFPQSCSEYSVPLPSGAAVAPSPPAPHPISGIPGAINICLLPVATPSRAPPQAEHPGALPTPTGRIYFCSVFILATNNGRHSQHPISPGPPRPQPPPGVGGSGAWRGQRSHGLSPCSDVAVLLPGTVPPPRGSFGLWLPTSSALQPHVCGLISASVTDSPCTRKLLR